MHVFVDESRRGRTYVLASVRVSPAHLAGVRRGLRAALLGSQRRIHFVNESVARRRQLLASFARLPIEAIAYRAVQVPLRHEPAIRAELLRALIDDIVPTGATRLVIESRSGRDELDRRTIHDRLLIHRSSTLAYEHLLPTEDPLLWLADTFAWVAGAGGDWTARTPNVLRVVDRRA